MSRSEKIVISRRSLLAAMSIGGAAFVIPGCSTGNENVTEGGTSGPVRGGTLRIVQSSDVFLSRIFSVTNVNFPITRTVFNPLTEYDHTTLEPKPVLAESWELADGGATVTFRLREGVTFHTGRPFTSEDVAWAVTILQQDDVFSHIDPVANAVADVSTKGDHEVTIRLEHPVSNLFDLFETMPIPDQETFAELQEGETVVGTGPFKVDSYTPGTGFSLSRYEDYWKPDQPYLDGVEISIISQSQSMLSSLRAGQADLVVSLLPADAATLRDDPGYEIVIAEPSDSCFYIGHNVKVEPLNDKRVRQAIAWAVDRERIVDQVLAGIGAASSLPWAPSSPAYDEAKVSHYSYDIDRAKALLAEAGASGAEINVAYNAGLPTPPKVAEIVLFNLVEAGLKATAMPMQPADLGAAVIGGEIPGLWIGIHGLNHMHPASLVTGGISFNADHNPSNFTSETYQQLAGELWKTGDEATARTASDQINDLLLDEQFVSDLVVSDYTYTTTTKLRGLTWNMANSINLDEAYLA